MSVRRLGTTSFFHCHSLSTRFVVHKQQHNNNTVKRTSPNTPSKFKSTKIREGIAQNNQREIREQRRIARVSHQSQTSIQKFYLALIMNIILVLMGAIVYLKPELIFLHLARSNGSGGDGQLRWPPRHLAILYPPGTRPQTDLPYFFQQYAIATPENQNARDAIRRLIRIRNRLKPFQIFISAWEREAMMSDYPVDDYCGAGFAAAYQHTFTQDRQRHGARHAEDLLVWCLLHTYQNDGFVQWNATLERSPMGASPHSSNFQYSSEDTLKGIVPVYPGQSRVHPSFLWLPKKRESIIISMDDSKVGSTRKNRTKTTFDMNSQIPAKILPWLIHTAPKIPAEDYARASEEFLYRLIQEEHEHWMTLDAVCNTTWSGDSTGTQSQENLVEEIDRSKYQHRRVMGRDCVGSDKTESVHCCIVYMPEGDIAMTRQSLRQQRIRSSSDS